MSQTASIDEELTKACKAGYLATARELVRQGANVSSRYASTPPLFSAAYSGHTKIVEWLLQEGADINIRNSVNSTALMGAAEQGHLDCVEALLEAGADKTPKNKYDLTARDFAIKHGHASIVAALDRNPDEVILSWPVGDRVLQEVFNFTQKERVTLIRKGVDGPVEAVTRDSFTEIADRDKLQTAFEKYKKQGGKRTEEEVFFSGATLKKPRLGR